MGMPVAPLAHPAGHRQPPVQGCGTGRRRGPGGGGSHRLIGVDDQGREQRVPVGEVAVEGRGRHLQPAGDGAQGKAGRARGRHLLVGGRQDLPGQLERAPGLGPGSERTCGDA